MTTRSRSDRPQRLRRSTAGAVLSGLAAIVMLFSAATAAAASSPADNASAGQTEMAITEPVSITGAVASSTVSLVGTAAAPRMDGASQLAPDPGCNETEPDCENEPANCNATVSHSYTRGDNPEFGGPYSRVRYDGYISCYGSGYVYVIGGTRLVDTGNGGPLGTGPSIYQPVEWGSPARSTGFVDLYDADWPAAQNAEAIFSFTAQQQYGVWNGCIGPFGSMRIIRCTGAGTSTLTVEIGTGSFATGVTDPCSDPSRSRTDEEATQLTYSSLVDDVRITFHPYIKWCWSGSRVVKITKYSKAFAHCDFDHPTWCDSQHFNIRPTTTDPDPFAVNGVGQYVVSFTVDITPPPFPASNLRAQTCIYVIDRIYRANGQKEIKDKLMSCQNR